QRDFHLRIAEEAVGATELRHGGMRTLLESGPQPGNRFLSRDPFQLAERGRRPQHERRGAGGENRVHALQIIAALTAVAMTAAAALAFPQQCTAVLVNFWVTSRMACVEETPTRLDPYRRFAPRGDERVAVASARPAVS